MIDPRRGHTGTSLKRLASAMLGAFLLSACATGTGPFNPTLVGTEWRLIHFQSSDDAIGMIQPRRDEVYSLRLLPDGSAAMQLSCNRGTGRWTSPNPHMSRGEVRIEPGAMTMAACPPSRLERISGDIANVRSFVIADRRLHLNLMMDGGDYVWIPVR